MIARRTPWWYYVVALLGGMALGAAAVWLDEQVQASFIGAPWLVSALLLLIGGVTLALAYQVHVYATTEPRKRTQHLDSRKALLTLVLAKTLALSGAGLAGWYAGQLLMSLPHRDASFYQRIIIECAVALSICVADMVMGLVSEWWCQIPPDDMDKARRLAERSRSMPAAEQ